jgi:DNA-binding YbaB/EbfC family protein
MFKEIGQIASMLKNLPKIKEEMGRLQARLSQITAEGDAGGGMVKVRVNGAMEILGFTLSDEAMKLNDKELLEDLLRAAANQALQRVRTLVAEETGKMATNLGLPAGMNIPGLSPS